MRIQGLAYSVILIVFLLLLGACRLQAPSSSPTQDPAVVYTAAAQTIVAQLTQAAVNLTPTAGGAAPIIAPPTSVPPDQMTPTEFPASPTPEVTATETPQASPTPADSPTPTGIPSDPRTSLGNPDFSDSFQGSENWSLYEDEHVSFEVNNGLLRMRAFNPDHWDGWMLSWPVISNYYLEMTAATKSCSGLDRYGMMARATKTDDGYVGYLFGVSCDGRYSLRSWDGKKNIILIDWTASDKINKGSEQTNRIGFLADGRKLAFYANGELLGELRDDTHEEGRFGVFVGAVDTPRFTVNVEEISYWELP